MPSFRHLFVGHEPSFPEVLTPESRRRGRSLLYRFYFLNGISVACLMNNVLILYAIRNGLTDATVAVMSSFIHLSMPFLILGKLSIARVGAARTRALGWFIRYVFAILMILAPFAARVFPQPVVTSLLLVGAFGFAAFRSIGVAAINPLQGEVVESDSGGDLVSTILLCVQSTYFLTMVLIILGFRYVDELWLYQLVLGVGCVVGLYASVLVAGVPESSAPLISARKSMREIVRVSVATPAYRRLVAAWCAGLACKAMVVPFTLIALKNGYGVSDYVAMLFTLLIALGSVVSGVFNKKVSDLVGARFLLMLYALGLIAVAGFWSLAPDAFLPFALGAVFFFTGFCDIGIVIGLNQHFLEVVHGEDRVGNSLLMRIASGAAAGLSASVLGGGLLRVLPEFDLAGLDMYRRYFLCILFLLLGFFFVLRRVERPRPPKPRRLKPADESS